MQPFARYNFHESLVDLELALCSVHMSRLDEAEARARHAIGVDLRALHDDDKLVAAWARTRILMAIPHLGDLAAAELELSAAKKEYLASCETLRQALGGLGEHPHIAKPVVSHQKPPL